MERNGEAHGGKGGTLVRKGSIGRRGMSIKKGRIIDLSA